MVLYGCAWYIIHVAQSTDLYRYDLGRAGGDLCGVLNLWTDSTVELAWSWIFLGHWIYLAVLTLFDRKNKHKTKTRNSIPSICIWWRRTIHGLLMCHFFFRGGALVTGCIGGVLVAFFGGQGREEGRSSLCSWRLEKKGVRAGQPLFVSVQSRTGFVQSGTDI